MTAKREGDRLWLDVDVGALETGTGQPNSSGDTSGTNGSNGSNGSNGIQSRPSTSSTARDQLASPTPPRRPEPQVVNYDAPHDHVEAGTQLAHEGEDAHDHGTADIAATTTTTTATARDETERTYFSPRKRRKSQPVPSRG